MPPIAPSGSTIAADPENRFVAGELEGALETAPSPGWPPTRRRIAEHDAAFLLRPSLSPVSFDVLARDFQAVWSIPTTLDARLKKRIVRTLIHEAVADIDDGAARDRVDVALGRGCPH